MARKRHFRGATARLLFCTKRKFYRRAPICLWHIVGFVEYRGRTEASDAFGVAPVQQALIVESCTVYMYAQESTPFGVLSFCCAAWMCRQRCGKYGCAVFVARPRGSQCVHFTRGWDVVNAVPCEFALRLRRHRRVRIHPHRQRNG